MAERSGARPAQGRRGGVRFRRSPAWCSRSSAGPEFKPGGDHALGAALARANTSRACIPRSPSPSCWACCSWFPGWCCRGSWAGSSTRCWSRSMGGVAHAAPRSASPSRPCARSALLWVQAHLLMDTFGARCARPRRAASSRTRSRCRWSSSSQRSAGEIASRVDLNERVAETVSSDLVVPRARACSPRASSSSSWCSSRRGSRCSSSPAWRSSSSRGACSPAHRGDLAAALGARGQARGRGGRRAREHRGHQGRGPGAGALHAVDRLAGPVRQRLDPGAAPWRSRWARCRRCSALVAHLAVLGLGHDAHHRGHVHRRQPGRLPGAARGIHRAGARALRARRSSCRRCAATSRAWMTCCTTRKDGQRSRSSRRCAPRAAAGRRHARVPQRRRSATTGRAAAHRGFLAHARAGPARRARRRVGLGQVHAGPPRRGPLSPVERRGALRRPAARRAGTAQRSRARSPTWTRTSCSSRAACATTSRSGSRRSPTRRIRAALRDAAIEDEILAREGGARGPAAGRRAQPERRAAPAPRDRARARALARAS